jgi:16S rRNA processing protein RimM
VVDLDRAAMVTIGRIIRPQGNRGQVVVASETDFAEARFAPGAVFETDGPAGSRTLVIAESRPHDARWVIGFDGVRSIDDAEALRGLELQVSEADLMPLGAGQYYAHQLEACRVVTTGGEAVGTVGRVEMSTGTPLLVVTDAAGLEVLVPLVETICRRIDVEARVIEIDPPSGLIALNAPGSLKGTAS